MPIPSNINTVVFGETDIFFNDRVGILLTNKKAIKIGIIYLGILSFLSWLATYILFKKGYKIKS